MACMVRTTWTTNNPDTIWNRLAQKLGREPTQAEVVEEVKRIKLGVSADLAGAGKLWFQRRR